MPTTAGKLLFQTCTIASVQYVICAYFMHSTQPTGHLQLYYVPIDFSITYRMFGFRPNQQSSYNLQTMFPYLHAYTHPSFIILLAIIHIMTSKHPELYYTPNYHLITKDPFFLQIKTSHSLEYLPPVRKSIYCNVLSNAECVYHVR